MLRVLFIRDPGPRYAPWRMALEDLGLEVSCNTPTQFVASKWWNEPLGLLALDLDAQELPAGVRGWDMLQKFREFNHSGVEPKVLVMSATNDAGSRLLGNINAVSAYLLKPVRIEHFVSTVQRLLDFGDTPKV